MNLKIFDRIQLGFVRSRTKGSSEGGFVRHIKKTVSAKLDRTEIFVAGKTIFSPIFTCLLPTLAVLHLSLFASFYQAIVDMTEGRS